MNKPNSSNPSYKINKYKQKLSQTSNPYEKAIYLYKISNYLKQSGGTFNYDNEILRISGEFFNTLDQIVIRNNVLEELKNKIKEHDNLMSDVFSNYKGYKESEDMVEYYSKLQRESREIIGDVLRYGN
jgi:hypothetical protein